MDAKVIFSWESQAEQYPEKGEPGIEHTTVRCGISVVDCLLYRDESGCLVGILNHYNEFNPWEKPGSCNVWVHPDHQRRGVASALLRDAYHRWPLKNEDQEWSREGHAWITGLIDKGRVDPTITHSVSEDPWDGIDLPGGEPERWWEK